MNALLLSDEPRWALIWKISPAGGCALATACSL